MKIHKYVGLDVHSDTTTIAVVEGDRAGEVRLYGQISSDLHALEKIVRKLDGDQVVLHVVYEAGPTGFVVYRHLQQLKIECVVVAIADAAAQRDTPEERPAGRGHARPAASRGRTHRDQCPGRGRRVDP